MLCFVGLIGTLLMGILGREAWNDSRAWRQLFAWSPGFSPAGSWEASAAHHCARNESATCQNCAVRAIRPVT